jgi:hypothetical protein
MTRPDENQPKDRKGNVIGIGDILVLRNDGEELRYRVLTIGSMSVHLESIDTFTASGNKERWEPLHVLWQSYEKAK